MTAVAAAFIRSKARRSFGFLKPYLFDSLLDMSTIYCQNGGSTNRLVEATAVYTDNYVCGRKQYILFLITLHVLILGIGHGRTGLCTKIRIIDYLGRYEVFVWWMRISSKQLNADESVAEPRQFYPNAPGYDSAGATRHCQHRMRQHSTDSQPKRGFF